MRHTRTMIAGSLAGIITTALCSMGSAAPAFARGEAQRSAESSAAVSSTVGAASADEVEFGRLMLVLDSSGSMSESAGGGQSKIAAAKNALRRVVAGLPDEAEVGLRVFGSEVFSRTDPGSCSDTQQVVAPGTDNRTELRSAIGDYEPYGETPIPPRCAPRPTTSAPRAPARSCSSPTASRPAPLTPARSRGASPAPASTCTSTSSACRSRAGP